MVFSANYLFVSVMPIIQRRGRAEMYAEIRSNVTSMNDLEH